MRALQGGAFCCDLSPPSTQTHFKERPFDYLSTLESSVQRRKPLKVLRERGGE